MTEVQRSAYIMALKDLFKEYELLAKYNGGTDYYRYCALDMAIQALEQPKTEPCEDCIRKQDEIRKAYDRGIENGLIPRETCEDTVSREKVLEQINCWIGSGEYGYTNATWYLNKRIKELPSVQPKTGHWIVDTDNSRRWDRVRFYCSECGDWQTYGKPKFCPNCGCRMESEE